MCKRSIDFPTRLPQAVCLVVLVAVNILIRAVWLFHYHPAQRSDFLWYYQHAVSLSEGHGYTTAGKPTAYWPIGYPLFLSLIFRITGPSLKAGLIAQALLSVGIVVLIFLIALRTTKSTSVATIAGLGYTVLPSSIITNSVMGTEELFTFLLLLSLYIYLCVDSGRVWLKLCLAGLCLGAACLVRPTVLLFPIFIFVYEWLIVRHSFWKSLGRVAVIVVMMGIAISPLTIRNEVAMHHFILISTNGGVNLWQSTKSNGYFWSDDPKVNPLLLAHNEIERNTIGEKAFEAYVIHHPKLVIENGFLKIWNLYKNDKGSNVQLPSSPFYVRLMQVDNTMYQVWIWIAIVGMIPLVLRYEWRKSVFLLVFIAYYTLIFFFFPAWSRFRFPLMPFWSVPFAACLTWPVSELKRFMMRIRSRKLRDAEMNTSA